MTNLLDAAIAKVRGLPESLQEEAAEMLFAIASRYEQPIRLDPETRVAVHEALAQAARGQFASDDEMEAIFRPRSG